MKFPAVTITRIKGVAILRFNVAEITGVGGEMHHILFKIARRNPALAVDFNGIRAFDDAAIEALSFVRDVCLERRGSLSVAEAGRSIRVDSGGLERWDAICGGSRGTKYSICDRLKLQSG
jgi:hypothetical protein